MQRPVKVRNWHSSPYFVWARVVKRPLTYAVVEWPDHQGSIQWDTHLNHMELQPLPKPGTLLGAALLSLGYWFYNLAGNCAQTMSSKRNCGINGLQNFLKGTEVREHSPQFNIKLPLRLLCVDTPFFLRWCASANCRSLAARSLTLLFRDKATVILHWSDEIVKGMYVKGAQLNAGYH